MKKLKKGLVGLLVLALLVAYFPVKTLLAEETLPTATDGVTETIVLSEAKGKTGDEVEVTLSTTCEIMVKALSISELEYDETKLQLVSGEWNLDGVLKDWGSYNKEEGVLAFADNTLVNGKFFTLTFKIIEETEDCDVTVTCKVGAKEKQDDGTETDLNLTVSAGKVSVETIKKQIVVGSGKGYTGKQISVPISLENNPGIISMCLSVDYDSSILELVSVTDSGNLGEAMHSNATSVIPYTLTWANDTALENITYNGQIVVLTFNVLENAQVGTTNITVSYNQEDGIYNFDLQPVIFQVVNGTYEISDVLVGDVNDDGRVNAFDRTTLARYLAKWDGYTADTINVAAADVNGDGKVNAFDRTILARYLAKWDGYTKLPHSN